MATALRKTGISVVGDMPWGTHFCSFYETKQDLLEILIPFFETGLGNNEFCLWIVSNSDLLTMHEARSALQAVVPDLDRYIVDRSIEIVGHDDWFLNGGSFDFHRVANRFKEKLDEALRRGYAGMRVNGSPAWILTRDPNELREFEAEVNQLFPHERIIASCTYPLPDSPAEFLLDVARNHQFAIARRDGIWDVVETPEMIQAKAEIERLNAQLEQRVIERTKKLEATTERLRAEIKDRKEAEEEVRESQQLLQLVLETLPVGVAVVNRAGDIELVNAASKDIWGGTIAGGRERWGQTRGHWHDSGRRIAPGEWASVRALSKGETSLNELIDIDTYDGRRKIIHNSAAPVRNEEGLIVGAVIVNQDVTDRVRAEEALRRSEDHLRLVIETIPVMAWTVRPDGVVDFLNRRWLDYAGLSLEQYVEDPMGPIHPDDIPRVMETWRAQMAIGGGYENEMRLRRADGEYRWFLVRTEPLRDAQGNVVKWYGTSTDITDRKRAEEQLRITSAQLRALSARLSSAREEEGTRIARELHDQLGSALTSLKWDLEGVSKRCSERVSQTDYAVLHDRLEEMMSLVDDILGNVRRISSELRPSILDDLGLIATIEWQARQFESRSGIICKVDVLVDNLQLSREQSTAVFRILQEALTNILRHAHATRVNILVDVDDGELILEVRDNGRGITDAQNTGSRSLGLIGMRERAHLLGGRMEITGTAGNGTLLILRVPVHVPTSN